MNLDNMTTEQLIALREQIDVAILSNLPKYVSAYRKGFRVAMNRKHVGLYKTVTEAAAAVAKFGK